jgi:hypothetical protein
MMGVLYDIANGKNVFNQVTDKESAERIKKDIEAGRRDRMAGYYDKWYRYNRSDDGAAYDKGQQIAMKNKTCPPDVKFIPCMH